MTRCGRKTWREGALAVLLQLILVLGFLGISAPEAQSSPLQQKLIKWLDEPGTKLVAADICNGAPKCTWADGCQPRCKDFKWKQNCEQTSAGGKPGADGTGFCMWSGEKKGIDYCTSFT